MRAYDEAFANLDPCTQIRLDLTVAHRWAARWNWNEGVVNHFTAVVPGHPDRFYAIPYGVHWTEVRPRDFLTVSLDGSIVEGDGEIELTSLMIHGAMHRALPRAQVILHTHQPHITAFTCLVDQSFDICNQPSLHFPGRIAYLNEYGLATESSIGGAILDAIGSRDILMMANHGVTVCGPNVSQAFDDLYMLDRACQVQLLAHASGRPLRTVAPSVITSMMDSVRAKAIQEGDQHFRALRRVLWREEPNLLE